MVAYRTDVQLQHRRIRNLPTRWDRTGRNYGCDDPAWRTVGAGIEAMLWANWMVRFEYRYANFGTISNTDLRTCPASGCGAAFTETVGYNVKVQTHTATFGLAYEFSDPLVASAAAPLVYKYRNLYNYSGPWSDHLRRRPPPGPALTLAPA